MQVKKQTIYLFFVEVLLFYVFFKGRLKILDIKSHNFRMKNIVYNFMFLKQDTEQVIIMSQEVLSSSYDSNHQVTLLIISSR